MPTFTRRAFLATLATALPAAALVRRAHAAAVDHLAGDPRTLRALADVVLSSEIGAPGLTAATKSFQQWIAGYREGAELVHGYGTSALGRTGPTPATRWATQLDALDASARKAHGRAFADLPVSERRTLVEQALAPLRPDRMPALARAPHVALALMAHWYASPAATDRCYEVRIGRQTCRPLAAQAREPLPLAQR